LSCFPDTSITGQAQRHLRAASARSTSSARCMRRSLGVPRPTITAATRAVSRSGGRYPWRRARLSSAGWSGHGGHPASRARMADAG